MSLCSLPHLHLASLFAFCTNILHYLYYTLIPPFTFLALSKSLFEEAHTSSRSSYFNSAHSFSQPRLSNIATLSHLFLTVSLKSKSFSLFFFFQFITYFSQLYVLPPNPYRVSTFQWLSVSFQISSDHLQHLQLPLYTWTSSYLYLTFLLTIT